MRLNVPPLPKPTVRSSTRRLPRKSDILFLNSRNLIALLAGISLGTSLAPMHAAAPAASPATRPGTLDIVSATWKVANQPDVDATATMLGMVKDGQLNLQVSAANLHILPPPRGITGRLVLTYRVNGGELQSETIRGGGTALRLRAEPVDGRANPGMANAGADGKTPILQLTSQEPREAINGATGGSLLVRELQRQAIGIAAREELGMRTRDMALGETLGKDVPGIRSTVLVGTQFWRAFGTDTILALPDDMVDSKAWDQMDIAKYVEASPSKLIGKIHGTLYAKPWIDFAMIIRDAETHSRKEFVAALRKDGVAGTDIGRSAGWIAKGVVPEVISAELSAMNPVAQFVAVRLIHDQMRAQGNSPELIEALVRGYANLAFMSNSIYSGAYKTYMARSLLYAERLVVHNKSDAHALYVRAYARGMGGLAALAMEDLDAAKKLGAGQERPLWSGIIDAWCHYDLTAMEEHAKPSGPYQSLAGMLAVAISVDGYSLDTIAQLGNACLMRNPDNVWVMQKLFESGQLGLTATMPDKMLGAMPSMLRSHTALLKLAADPEMARTNLALENSPQLDAVAAFKKSLDQSAQDKEETGEPSLGALSALIRDEEFTGVYSQAKYLHFNLGITPDEIAPFVKKTAVVWTNHPLAGLVQATAISPLADYKNFRAAIDQIQPIDAGGWLMADLRACLPWKDFVDKWNLVLLAEGHGDVLPMDQTLNSLGEARLYQGEFIGALREVSPFAALPMMAWMNAYPAAMRLEDQNFSEQTIADVEKRFSDRPRMIYFAAHWASDIHDFKKSIALLEALQRKNPTIETARSLLNIYDQTGDMVKAKAVVDDAGKLSIAGLEEASLCSDFATMLKRRFLYAQALPYDTKAADSFSSWGLTGLASCQEGLGAPDQVAIILKANAERYPGRETLRWYAWAKRNQRPELPLATAALNEYFFQYLGNFSARADKALFDGDPAKALEILKAHEQQMTSFVEFMDLAVVAAEAHDSAQIDFALKRAADIEKQFVFTDLIAAMLAITQGGDIPAALLKVEIQTGAPVTSHYLTLTWLGRFLAATGHKPEAIRFLKFGLMQNGQSSDSFNLTWQALAKIGENPAKILLDLRNHRPDLAPLYGTWKTQDGQSAVEWKFDKDFTVESSDGCHGTWWESDGRILISWTPSKWAMFSWPNAATAITGDSHLGTGKLTLSKK